MKLQHTNGLYKHLHTFVFVVISHKASMFTPVQRVHVRGWCVIVYDTMETTIISLNVNSGQKKYHCHYSDVGLFLACKLRVCVCVFQKNCYLVCNNRQSSDY